MFNFLSFITSLLHSIPFRRARHILACITLDLISLSSVPLVSKITPKYSILFYFSWSVVVYVARDTSCFVHMHFLLQVFIYISSYDLVSHLFSLYLSFTNNTIFFQLNQSTTCVCKPEAANTVRAPDDERYAARNMLNLQWTVD